MKPIPRAVVTARRTAGVLLVLAVLLTIIAAVVVYGSYVTRAPTVNPVQSQPLINRGSAEAPALSWAGPSSGSDGSTHPPRRQGTNT